MQKQKTIAKWLAIILLAMVAVGSYILYDALYIKKVDNQATADDYVDENPNEDEEDTPVHVPYYTTLPRQPEKIDGVSVTHFGGEGIDTVQNVVNYGGKRYAVFSSTSTEFDLRESGLHVAVIGEGVEAVVRLGDDTYVDGKMTAVGPLFLTKNSSGGHLYLLGLGGEIRAQISLPTFTDGKLYLSGNKVLLFTLSNGRLTCHTVLDNMTLQSNPFLLSTLDTTIHQVFDNPLGQVLVCGDDDNTSIYLFEQNTGFRLLFARDKLSFRQIVTAGTAVDTSYILHGKSGSESVLVSFDTTFQVSGVKTVEDVTDGFLFPYGDGLQFVGDGVTKSYCRHLDLVASSPNSLSFEKVVALTPSREGFLAVSVENGTYKITLTDGEILLTKTLDIIGEIVGISSSNVGFTILVNTSSTLGLFRANFGEVDAYVLDFGFQFFA